MNKGIGVWGPVPSGVQGQSPWPLLVLIVALALSACGKEGDPKAPGPPDQITYPKIYPTH